MGLSASSIVDWVDPRELKEHLTSRNIYGEDPVDDLVASVREHGLLEPLYVRPDNTIISGHRRWRAALLLGMPLVPIIRVANGNEDEETMSIVEHNRYRTKSGEQLLREGLALEPIYASEARLREKAGLSDDGEAGGRGRKRNPEENLPRGFRAPQTRDRIAQALGLGNAKQWEMLKKLGAAADQGNQLAKDLLPRVYRSIRLHRAFKQVFGASAHKFVSEAIDSQEPQQPLLDGTGAWPVRPSERILYHQDGVTLIHGDCRWMRELDDETVDLIITDPPFNVGFSSYGGGVNDRLSPEAYATWTREWIQECLRVLVPGGQIYALMPVKSMPWWLGEIRDLWDIHHGHYLAWCKTMANLHQEATFIRAHEPVLWLTKGGRPNVFHREFRFPADADWFKGSSAIGEVETQPFRKAHPTPRPTWLVEKFMLLASDPGMVVLDPMLGSGTTAWVSRRLGRRCVGYDINAGYLELARRWLAQPAAGPSELPQLGTSG